MFNLNGWKYWTMGAPINYRNGSPCTILINRKPLDYQADYDLIADRYDTLFQDAESHRENMEIFGMIPIRHSDRILDVGCGPGLFLECTSLWDKLDYTGIDPSTKMLQRLAAQFPEYSGNVVNARLEEFYDGEGFDLIISLFGAANYIEPSAWPRVLSMLRPGGRVFAMFYQERYIPITYERTGIAFPHNNASDYDLSKFVRTNYKDTFLIAEYQNFKYKLPSPSSSI
jgi:SAM-dependent methyltransferase